MGEQVDSFDGLKVFSATTLERREHIGDEITAWLQSNPQMSPVDAVVRLSSDWRFHCLSILIFWRRTA